MSQAVAEFLVALERDNLERLGELLDLNPSLAGERDPQGVSLVLRALYLGKGDAAQKLLAKDPVLDAFTCAAVGDWEALERALDAQPELLERHAADGFTLLQLAAFFGQPAVVEHLLARGAKANTVSKNPSKLCALHSAAAARNERSLRALLANGADPNARQAGGFTALQSVALSGELALVEMLLAHGARRADATDNGQTAASLARSRGHEALARRLES